MIEDIFSNRGIVVQLTDSDSFLKIKETLTRIGILSKREKVLWQSSHILHKRGYYAIMHFKELFALDGRPTDICETDIARRNTITKLLESWGLLTVEDQSQFGELFVPINQINILSHKVKNEYQLIPKYSIGIVKNEK